MERSYTQVSFLPVGFVFSLSSSACEFTTPYLKTAVSGVARGILMSNANAESLFI